MYLLFFVSGFLFPKGNGLDIIGVLNSIKRKFFSLIIPWLFGGLAYHYFRGLEITVLWFLMSLFSFTIINLAWELIRPQKNTPIIDFLFYMVITIIMMKLLPQNIKDIFQLKYGHYLLYSLGIMTKRYNLTNYIEKQWVNTISGAVFIAINVLKINGIEIPQSNILTAITGSIVFWNIFKFVLTEGFFYEFMKTLGFYSLEIYIMHGFFIIKIYEIGVFISTLSGYMDDKMTRSTLELLAATLIAMPVIAMCLIFIKATKNNTIVNFLFGKIKI